MILQLGLHECRELAHLFDLQIDEGKSCLSYHITVLKQLLLSGTYDAAAPDIQPSAR